jgi:hypothetical protein
MSFEILPYLPGNFDPQSRVWIYQSSRLFSKSEALDIAPMLANFVAGWQTHGRPVKGFANLLFENFIVIMADESAAGVSGCSTDSSVRLIKQIEEKFQVDLFNRQNLAFIIDDTIQLLPLAKLNEGYENNSFSVDTLYFNNLVATKEQLINEWIIPISKSWLKTKIKQLVAH